MKRDMDLARSILLALEADPKAIGPGFVNLSMEGRDQAEVYYHVYLLKNAGLVEAVNMTNSRDGLVWLPSCLTTAGHEFIEASRKDSIWQKAKTLSMQKAGGLSLDVLKDILIKLATDAVTGFGS